MLRAEQNKWRWSKGQGVLQLTELGQNKKHELVEHLFRERTLTIPLAFIFFCEDEGRMSMTMVT